MLIVAGPTASGKTSLAVGLAERLGAEIINADSRQIYRGLDIGTAKPSTAEQARARHHLLDIVDVDQSYSAGRFAEDARAAIEDIVAKGLTPVVCGGTGFYIGSLLEPMFEEPEIDPDERERFRAGLNELAEREGRQAVHSRLAEVDPQSAQRLHPNDLQRVGRALELYELTGTTMSDLHARQNTGSGFEPFTVLLDPPVEEHDRWIDGRTEQMLDAGWEEEVRALLEAGVSENAPGLESLGYEDVIALVRGRIGRQEAIAGIALKTRQYARRQRTWFKRMEAALRADPRRIDPAQVAGEWEKFNRKIKMDTEK